jgi:hypothetical protein
MCVSSAAGSLFWERLGRKGASVATFCGLVLTLLCARLLESIGGAASRLLLVLLGAAPLGFSMGLYLPAGLNRAAGKAARYLALDSVGAALGFAVFYAAALNFGLLSSLLLASFAYGAALIIWPSVDPS